MAWASDQSSLLLALAVLATLLLLVQTARLWLRGGAERRRAARARRLGKTGERDAARLLKRAGYRVLAEQASGAVVFEVDGETRTAHLRPDFVFTRGGRRYVADAKAGADATKLGQRGTRRQLLEYALAFPDHTVLLVDTEHGRIQEVRFPRLAPAVQTGRLLAFGIGLVVGGTAVAVAASWS